MTLSADSGIIIYYHNGFERRRAMTEKRDMDGFWDIESLIPEKKNTGFSSLKRPSYDTSAAEVEASPTEEKTRAEYTGAAFTRFIPPHTARELEDKPKPVIEYELEHSLVHKVRIYRAESKYDFYERFLDDMRRYRDRAGVKCPPVPFFSYTPQYSQMNRAQLSYYFWWRENVRKGEYISADYSYVLLYLYELINLAEESDKQKTLDMMCNIWLHYGNEHPFVSKYLGEWVCDFCLIHRLPVPSERLRPIYPTIMKSCLVKEFYVTGGRGGVGKVCSDTLIDIASAYDYRKSRYATEDRLPTMRKHLVGALNRVLSDNEEGNPLLDGMRVRIADNSATRISYSGALCSKNIRRRIEIDYYSFTKSYELRYLVSDILKYSENRLRKIWGIKSRLNIYALPTSIKKCIDGYFDEIMPAFESAQKKEKNFESGAAEYEKLYDVPRAPLSLSEAARIEESSWETTKILVETFEDDSEKTENIEESVSPDANTVKNVGVSFSEKLGEGLDFLLAVLANNVAEQRRITERLSVPSEMLVDEINELAADLLGDVLIEEDGEGYTVIPDYREMVEAMRTK